MQNDDDHKPGKALQPQQQNNLPATLATGKKLVQHLKTALANSRRDLVEDDGWVERLVHGLEAGINQYTVISAVIKTANGEQELAYLPRDKAIWLALTRLQFSSNWASYWKGNLKSSGLEKLPAEISQLQNLQELHLWGNQLTTLPAEMGQLQNLQKLYLGGNQLTTLPAEMGQLQNLQTLWLGDNKLTTLPAEIGQLQNLQTLWLVDNKLTTLPAEIGQLQNLQILGLGFNQLTTLPAEIGQLHNLERLNLRDNPLRSLPISLKRLYRERNDALGIWLDDYSLLEEGDDNGFFLSDSNDDDLFF